MYHNHGKTTTSRPLYLTKQTIALTFLISLTPAISYADASAQYSLQESVTVTGVSGYSIIGDLVYTTNSASQVNTVSGNGTNTYNSLTYTPSTNTDATTNSSKVGFSFADTAAITYPTSNNLSSSASSSSSVNENLFITNNSGAAQNVAITYNVLGGVDTYTYQQSSTLLSSAVIAASATKWKGLYGALFVGFEVGEALVEGEGLLNLFQTVGGALEANPVHLFHCVKALINGRKLALDLTQLRCQEML